MNLGSDGEGSVGFGLNTSDEELELCLHGGSSDTWEGSSEGSWGDGTNGKGAEFTEDSSGGVGVDISDGLTSVEFSIESFG